jgi:uncharacterized delta-60 repeat protein
MHRSIGHFGNWTQGLIAAVTLAGSTSLAVAQTPSADALNPVPSYWVSPLALQADGKILIGGGFTTVSNISRVRLARLNPDGVLDTTFNPPAISDSLYAIAIQPDGKILIGGDFTTLGPQTCYAIGRLNPNGTRDTTFSTHVLEPPPFTTITARIQAIVVQPDGKIIIGGRFSANGGPVGSYISRLNTNGTLDSSFTRGISGGPITTLALQTDGKILVGGLFSTANGLNRPRLARLNGDGTTDSSFFAEMDVTAAPIVLTLAVQPDQRILVGGYFNSVGGQPRTNLARLNPDSGLDNGFNPGVTGVNSTVYSLQVQADGNILVAGIFTGLGGAPRERLGRLLPDGSVDAAFTCAANLDVYGLALQADGKVLAGGFFTQLAGQNRGYVGRLNNLEPAEQSLSIDGSNIVWRRAGSICEVWRTTFDYSTDGTNWITLGEGMRDSVGWELDGVVVPPAAQIRARGYTTGGGFNSSSWFVESIWPPVRPAIVTNDSSFGARSNQFGFNVAGSAGSTVIIEGTTNLIDWTPVSTNVFSSSNLDFNDPNWSLFQSRFYRVRLE